MTGSRQKRGLRPDSAPWKLSAFFEQSPDEELTIDDIMAKFGISRISAYDAVKANEGELERVSIVRLKARRP